MEHEFIAHFREADRTKQTITEHLRETANLARENAERIGLPLLGELCGLLHDVGKYSDEFQHYIQSSCGLIQPGEKGFVDSKKLRGKIDHGTAGAQLIWESGFQKNLLEIFLRQLLALCVVSHHSGLLDCIEPKDGIDRFSKRMEKDDAKTHLSEVRRKIDTEVLQGIEALIQSSEIREELKTLMQKVLKAEPMNYLIRDFRHGMLARFLFSCLIDADRTDTADFVTPDRVEEKWKGQYPDWESFIQALESRLEKFQTQDTTGDEGNIYKLRAEISSNCREFGVREKGLYSLTVPTGGGKTLASLRFALYHAKRNKISRIIYVVPYTSIIDQNAEEVRKIFEELSQATGKEIVLEHHSNLTPEKDTFQGKLFAENWDAPIIYTTAVQFLETLFGSGTRGVRRMHQLANAVIVFDEIQTLPVRIVHLFNNAINFLLDLCGSTVVFCTATQPCLDKVDPEKGAISLRPDHEMMSNVKKLFKQLQRVEVQDRRKAGGWTEEEVAELAYQNLQSAKTVLIIVNTKSSAKRLFELCKHYDAEVYHLSTNMCPAHRLDILGCVKECLDSEGDRPAICISTQLIEAGVDVDFGAVIRYLAGLDSIAQAAGRCNRHGRRDIGYVYVVNPANENLDKLEDICIAQEEAQRVFDEYKVDPQVFGHDIIGIEAMNRYYKYYFFKRAPQMTYPVPANVFNHEDNILSLLSSNKETVGIYYREQKKAPPLVLRHSFQSAAKVFKVIETSTQGVIVPYSKEGEGIISELCSAFEVDKQYELIKKAQRYAVNLFPNMFKALSKNGAIFEVQEGSGIFYLLQQHYSNDFGVAHEVVNEMAFLHCGD